MIPPLKLVAGVVGVAGLVVILAAAGLVVRGPFLGGPLLAPPSLLGALCAFVVGIAATAWGVTRYVRA